MTQINQERIKPLLAHFEQEGLGLSNTLQLALSRLKALHNFKTLLSLALRPAVLEKNERTKKLFEEFQTILSHTEHAR